MEISNLPAITFAAKDVTTIEAAVITTYESIAEKTLAPGDPVRLFLETIASIIVQQRALIDYTGKQNLLAYSTGDYLDHIGVLVDTDRLTAAAASTTLRFTLSAVQTGAVIIPAGTRATPGDNLLFATSVVTTIPAGDLYVDVNAVCMSVGVAGNNYMAGQINKLVDPIQWIESVTNTTVSEGGADIETDSAYRERIRQAPERFSVAGPDGAYLYHAKAASSLITDVAVYSPSAGVVEIRPLLAGGVVPGNEILDAVKTACSAKTVRPLTDKVQVLAPEAIAYNVDVVYYINQDNATIAASIQTAVITAVNEWVLWQKSKLGRDVNPSELITRMVSAGAKRVTVSTPNYTAIESYQVAIAGTVTVALGGLEDG